MMSKNEVFTKAFWCTYYNYRGPRVVLLKLFTHKIKGETMVYSVFGGRIEVARLINKRIDDNGVMRLCIEKFEKLTCPEDIGLDVQDTLILRSSDHPNVVMNYYGPIVGIHMKKVGNNIQNLIFSAQGGRDLGDCDIMEATAGDFVIANKTSMVDLRLERLGYKSPRKVTPIEPKKRVIVKVRKPVFKNTEDRIKHICKKYHVVKVTASTM